MYRKHNILMFFFVNPVDKWCVASSGGQSTQINYMSKSTDTYY